MKNIEKYKNQIINAYHADLSCCVHSDILHLDCVENCSECKKYVVEWLLEEYSEPILDDVERKYLSAIIKPFKNYVTGIIKVKDDYEKDKCFIRIIVKKSTYEYLNFPWFEENTMYKGMKENKKYTLEELGL